MAASPNAKPGKQSSAETKEFEAGSRVEKKYDESLKQGGNWLWENVLGIARSGFGKGMMFAAGMLLVGGLLLGGHAAGMGALQINGMAATVDQGAASGLTYMAIALATNPVAWAAIIGGGIVGHYMSKSLTPKPSLEEAEAKAKKLEAMRQRMAETSPQPEQEKDAGIEVPTTPPVNRSRDNPPNEQRGRG